MRSKENRVHPYIYILRQLFPMKASLIRITWKHLLKTEMPEDSHSGIHGGAWESVRQTHLVSSVLMGVWNVLEHQQLYGWYLVQRQ